MDEFITRENWLSAVKKQEEKLKFDSFDNRTALDIGMNIIKFAEEKYQHPVAISIEIDNVVVFSHQMIGISVEKKLWLFRKANVSKKTGTSSLLSLLSIKYGGSMPEWNDRPDSYIACGGCWAVHIKNTLPFAYITVSGLEHYLDHQIIIDAISSYLGVSVSTITI